MLALLSSECMTQSHYLLSKTGNATLHQETIEVLICFVFRLQFASLETCPRRTKADCTLHLHPAGSCTRPKIADNKHINKNLWNCLVFTYSDLCNFNMFMLAGTAQNENGNGSHPNSTGKFWVSW